MSDPTPATPGPVLGSGSPAVPVSPGQLSWLRQQVQRWQQEGLVSAEQSEAILRHYQASRHFSVGRLMLSLGAVLVSIGLIWLVAANLDELNPLLRFAVVVLLWLAALVGSEVLAARGTSRVIVEAVRLMAALGIGAVTFQAAQSLQVPAYEPKLIGFWAVAALLQAYLLRSVSALLVGVLGISVWSIWQGLWWPDPTFARGVLVLTLSGVVALSVAALHERWRLPFVAPWRHLGVAFVLVGLFVAAIPIDTGWEVTWTWWPILLLVLAVVGAAVSLVWAPVAAKWEVLGSLGVVGIGALLAAWNAGGDVNNVTAADWGHAIVGVVAYVIVAVAIAVVGTVRDSWLITGMAAVGLVIFTTFQSFAVFAPIIQGAWLFVVLGLVFLATGVGFDRARRQVAARLDDDDASKEATR